MKVFGKFERRELALTMNEFESAFIGSRATAQTNFIKDLGFISALT